MKKSILLTGATGFVGKQLLQLLIKRGHHVYIIVRNKLGKTPEQRIAGFVGSENGAFVTLIPGDLTQEGAGISPQDLDVLRGKVDTVIHSAALVKFDQNLAKDLYEINVEGTRRMLQIAKEIGARHFYYVSTAYTAGLRDEAREELHPVTGPFHNPYEQTKCIAEHLVVESATADFRTAIFRPSVIIGNSRTGLADTSLTIYGFIKGVRVFTRKMIDTLHSQTFRIQADPDATQNVVPVDYVCETLAAAVDQEVQAGIYHLTNSQPPTNQQIFSTILKRLNLSPTVIQICKDLREDEMSPQEKLLNSLIATYRVYLFKKIRFSDTNTRHLLQQQGISPLHLDQASIEFILSAYTNRG